MPETVSKLIIKSYASDEFTSETGEFIATINPQDLKLTSSVDYYVAQGMGNAQGALRYHASPPRVLTFKLLFDNTGIIPGSEKSVQEQVEELHKTIYDYQEDSQAPHFVRVTWGIIDFKGRLVNFETHYTLFQSDGFPIRAEADIAILENKESAIQQAAAASSQEGNNAQQSGTDGQGTDDADQAAGDQTSEGDQAEEGEGGEGSEQVEEAAAAEAEAQEDVRQVDPTEEETLTSVAAQEGLPPQDLAAVNGLDSLRPPSLPSLAVPTLAAMLAMLAAMALAYAKKGGDWLSKKGKQGKDYADSKT